MEYRVEEVPSYAHAVQNVLNMLSEDEGWELAGILPAAGNQQYNQIILQRPRRGGYVRD